MCPVHLLPPVPFASSREDRRTSVTLYFRELPGAFFIFCFQLSPPFPPLPLHDGRTAVMPSFFHSGFNPHNLAFLVLCVNFGTDCMFPAFVAAYQAFLFDPCVLGIPVSPASNLPYASRIVSVPAVYVRTRSCFSSFRGIRSIPF